jgi:hypothetical protein
MAILCWTAKIASATQGEKKYFLLALKKKVTKKRREQDPEPEPVVRIHGSGSVSKCQGYGTLTQ